MRDEIFESLQTMLTKYGNAILYNFWWDSVSVFVRVDLQAFSIVKSDHITDISCKSYISIMNSVFTFFVILIFIKTMSLICPISLRSFLLLIIISAKVSKYGVPTQDHFFFLNHASDLINCITTHQNPANSTILSFYITSSYIFILRDSIFS